MSELLDPLLQFALSYWIIWLSGAVITALFYYVLYAYEKRRAFKKEEEARSVEEEGGDYEEVIEGYVVFRNTRVVRIFGRIFIFCMIMLVLATLGKILG